MKQSIKNNGLALAGYAAICTLLVALIDHLTEDKIAHQQQQLLLQTLSSVMPADRYDSALTEHCILVTDKEYLGNDKPHQLFLAFKNGQPQGAIVEATAPDGYSGSIQLMVGVSLSGEITGVNVIKHKETPGLGDKIEARKSDWLAGFVGKYVKDVDDKRWAVKKDNGMFDQFTGATITPRAVVQAVKKAALYLKQNQTTLFAQKPSCNTTSGGDNE